MPSRSSGVGFTETSSCRQGYGVARSMQNTNDHHLILVMHIVDCIAAFERDAKASRQLLAQWPRAREDAQRLAGCLDVFDEPGRNRLTGLSSDIGPGLGQVCFCRGSQPEEERPANSLLPCSTMRETSKSSTRPAATSARPTSMSALSVIVNLLLRRALHCPIAQRRPDNLTGRHVVAGLDRAFDSGGYLARQSDCQALGLGHAGLIQRAMTLPQSR